MQVPIVKGIYVDGSDYREAYPINLMPLFLRSGISDGYLKLADGVVNAIDTSDIGLDRGGINVNGHLFRVIGAQFYSISSNNVLEQIGEVTDNARNASFAQSFDRIGIVSNGNFYQYQFDSGFSFIQVTDPDLGVVTDLVWADGYFVLTDGEFLIVTELNDPTAIDPLKFASSEADPDPIVALLKLRNEVIALNRYTIETFTNVGGTGFPFARVEGAQIMRGCVGREACTIIDNSIMFLGGGLNEEVGIYEGINGLSRKISYKELDRVIAGYTEQELSLTKMEVRLNQDELLLYVHFLRDTYVYNLTTSRALNLDIWFRLDSFTDNVNNYFDAWNFTYCYDRWYCGRRSQPDIGNLSRDIKSHWGITVNWEFQTPIIFNEDKGVIVHELALQTNMNSLPIQNQSVLGTQYSYDGVNFSQIKYIGSGTQGDRTRRYRWRNNGYAEKTRIQRFLGNSDVDLAFSRLDANVEGLRW